MYKGGGKFSAAFTGYYAGKKGERCTCNLPVIREPEAFKDNIYETWLSVPGIRTGVCRQN